MLVDSHCHLPLLDLQDLGGSLDAVLSRAGAQGVGHFLCVSVDLPSFPDVLRLAQTYDRVFASVGVHPNTRSEDEPTVEGLAALALDPAVIAIGETGLDYYRSSGDLNWQRERLRVHIAAARKVRKPLIIHMREAAEDVLGILAEEGAEEVGGVMHCFTGDHDSAHRAMELNFYISFSGIVTFHNASALQAVAQEIPLERLLVETDSPYLAPVPHRGRQNQPAYVREVAEHLAELRDMRFDELAEATTQNFFRLFRSARDRRD
ncbi:MAG: TatD family hydrolase [Gammaproteobacteria bacterium]|nr:TatD family hydrolase [Gammaproteobacteria bacterium]